MKVKVTLSSVLILSFVSLDYIGLLNGENIATIKGKVQHVEKNKFENDVFKYGLLPLPNEDAIVIDPLPLPINPPHIPEPLTFSKNTENTNKRSINHSEHKVEEK
ncbi:hypothetical protein [Bacillus sp. 2205SS5-2]|uniref:hypothetical protein n=1 Tax=Bacillus sp. 2205SS5-2 TaxID=3109031 RepID=UPI00300521EC